MKKNNILSLLAIGLLVVSCDLDKYPYSEVAADEYVTDDESVNTLVIGCYHSLHDVMYYEWAMTELRSDNARMYNNNSSSNLTKLVEQLDQGTISADNAWVETYWNACYATIANVNNVLDYIDVVEDETLRNQYEGEVLFLRALEYFNLVRLFGPVFIVTATTSPDTARDMQRSTVDEVYALIESDLENVVNNEMLPETMDDDDLGRADLNAARALLAKVYATHYTTSDSQYATALELCLDVLQSDAVGDPQSGSDLVAFADIFDIDNEMNAEIIFAVRYLSGNVDLGSPFGNMFAPLNNGGNVIIGTTYSYNMPSNDIITAYGNRGSDDVRLDVNIAQQYYNSTTEAWVTTNCPYCCKYTYEVSTEFDGESDWPVIRVADIALLYAELANELYGPTALAFTYLNMVCERAGVSTYSTTDLTNRYEFRTAVREERRLELAFENQRWFDLLRWGTATETVNDFLTSETFYSNYSYTVSEIEDWQTILPIPVSVLDINPDVAQNAGY